MKFHGGMMMFTMKKPKILIVEDEGIVAHDIRYILEGQGCEVTGIAVSGRQAIEQARNQPPDVVLMDIRIQGDLNGIEAAFLLQQQLERHVPVVFLTALSPSEFQMLQPDTGIYLNKPFTDEDLIQTLQLAVQRSF